MLEQERSATLERLISALPGPLRDALVLSTLEEIAPREVAVMLGISEAAVRSRSFRAREILRDRLVALAEPRTESRTDSKTEPKTESKTEPRTGPRT